MEMLNAPHLWLTSHHHAHMWRGSSSVDECTCAGQLQSSDDDSQAGTGRMSEDERSYAAASGRVSGQQQARHTDAMGIASSAMTHSSMAKPASSMRPTSPSSG